MTSIWSQVLSHPLAAVINLTNRVELKCKQCRNATFSDDVFVIDGSKFCVMQGTTHAMSSFLMTGFKLLHLFNDIAHSLRFCEISSHGQLIPLNVLVGQEV